MTRACILALATLTLMGGSAYADQFAFLHPYDPPYPAVTWNGVYVNPYSANNNTNPQNNPLTIYCDDWNTDFSGNPTWNANVYAITAGNVTNFKYGNTTTNYNVDLVSGHLTVTASTIPSAFNRYLEAAWLDEQWEAELLSGDDANTKADIQRKLAASVWTLFVDSSHVGTPHADGSTPTNGLIGAINSSGYAQAVSDYLDAAEAAIAGGYTAAGWYVVVPQGNNSSGVPMQEFLFHGSSGDTSVPEPGAVVLLSTVFGCLGLVKFRKGRQRQVS